MAKKIKTINSISIQITAIVILLFLILSVGLWQPGITGAVIANDQEWETILELTVDNSIEIVQTEIVFGEYKPTNCADGIYIEKDGQEISFETENEVYESGVCISTDIIFNNWSHESRTEFFGGVDYHILSVDLSRLFAKSSAARNWRRSRGNIAQIRLYADPCFGQILD